MRFVSAQILPFALSLLVALTGQAVAASRGMERATGQMVLCTGSGPVVVYIDANGAPTAPPHYCPDYAQVLLSALAIAGPDLPRAPRRTHLAPAERIGNLIVVPCAAHPARAPPLVV